MTRRLQALRTRGNDHGATLLLVLIIITVVALVTAGLLAFSETSIRTTVALRFQGASAYDADGAASTAVNQIKNDKFNNLAGQCVSSASGLSLPNFYPGTNGSAAASAYVQCTPGPNDGQGGDPNQANTSPGSALLALDANLGEDGIYINVNAGPTKIRGGVFSNSKITAPSGLTNVWSPPPTDPTRKTYNIARGACDTTKVIVANPAYGSTICDYGNVPDDRGADPGTLTPHGGTYDIPAVAPANGTIGTCTGVQFQTVTPGRFTDAGPLNNLTGCANKIVWFKPGKYYFDLQGINGTTWDVPAIFVIAGTPTIPFTTTPTAAQMPSACIVPGATTPGAVATTTSGAEFIFGGDTKLSVNRASGNDGSQLTICASNSDPLVGGGPPMAVYGLKTALGGTFPVRKETLCPPAGSCSLIDTGNSPKATLTIQGTTYAPPAFINVILNNNTKKVFYWGLIANAISFTGTGSADISNSLVDVPDQAANPTPSPTGMLLEVYVCPAVSSCNASGTPKLRVKVKVSSTSPRAVTVVSWASPR
jgi:hypothetical protein